MTTAVCIRCGALKHGATTRCGNCSFLPETTIDKAKAMVLSDHHLKIDGLRDFSSKIAAGVEISFPAELVEQYVKTFEDNPNLDKHVAKFVYGCLVLAIFTVAAAIFLVAKHC